VTRIPHFECDRCGDRQDGQPRMMIQHPYIEEPGVVEVAARDGCGDGGSLRRVFDGAAGVDEREGGCGMVIASVFFGGVVGLLLLILLIVLIVRLL
jgi:hypothetical protein